MICPLFRGHLLLRGFTVFSIGRRRDCSAQFALVAQIHLDLESSSVVCVHNYLPSDIHVVHVMYMYMYMYVLSKKCMQVQDT